MNEVSLSDGSVGKKPGIAKRMLMAVTPKRFHRFYTVEAAVAYQVSGFISFWQGFAAARWDDILVWATPKLELLSIWWTKTSPVLQGHWKAVREAVESLLDLAFGTN